MEQYDMALVDEIKKRLGASYDEVLMGLDEGGGDMLRALAAIERHREEQKRAEQGGELIGRAIGLAKEGRLQGLRVVLADRAIRDVPLPKGIGGALIGEIITGVLSQLKVELVEKSPEESQEDVEFPGEDEE
ncbi:MAG: hypothetical protein ABSD48_11015 [Armatimonadota bacterium]|jgi:hypothetical protein